LYVGLGQKILHHLLPDAPPANPNRPHPNPLAGRRAAVGA
jgi:hypothetical protein